MNFDFIEVFTRAAKITWKYKVLWIFGILASCGRNSGSNSNSSGNNNGNGVSENPFNPQMTRQLEDFVLRMGNWFEQNTWVLWALGIFVLFSIALQIFFNLVGTAGLARGVVRVENGAETLPFGELFSESLGYFWRLFGAALVIWLPFVLIFIAIFSLMLIPMILSSGTDMISEAAFGGGMLLFFISMCCCLFPISIVANLYHLQVARAITVDNLGVFASLARGWQVMSKNIIVMLIIGVVLFFAGLIVGVILIMPVFLLMLPLITAFMQGDITSWTPFITSGILVLCYSPILWLLTGIVMTYTESVWTLTYLRLTKPAEEPAIIVEGNA